MRAMLTFGKSLVCLASLVVAACGSGDTVTEFAPPLDPQPYGEEAENPEVFVDTMEVGSRELYAARDAVLAAAKVSEDTRIADIGAGTGLYSLMFAGAVGTGGTVYAVDIEPRFLRLINQRAADLDFKNVVSVLGRDADITIPDGAIDIAFIADTYHYFADRPAIMKTVRDALVRGGRLIVLDYNLSASNAGDGKHDHVRFGKAGLINEIESFGFKLIEEPPVEGLSDFFMVVFVKDDAPVSDASSANLP